MTCSSRPREILSTLHQNNSSVLAVNRDIYNIREKFRQKNLAGRTPIQALINKLKEGNFVYEYKCDDTGCITHLFFAHNESVALTRQFSSVLLMDCTYKTNKFKMPLLNVIGITSFNTTFNSCFIFMKGEEKTDYQWALTHIAHLFDGMSKPGVIVTDRELALMNALEMIFPNSANLLCLWHIRKNILKNCKQHFSIAVENDEEGDGWQLFLGKWNDVVESITEVEFNEKWQMFCSTYDNKPHVITYFKDTWIPWKEKFVKAWTNGFFHLGTTVTSRVEGAHSNLKANLQVSTGDLYRVHAVISLMFVASESSFFVGQTFWSFLSFFGRDPQLEIVEAMTCSSRPREILSTLHQNNSSVLAVNRDIYNIREKFRQKNLAGRTPIQALINKLKEGNFVYEYKCDDTGCITHLFFAHNESVALTRQFSSVLLMDCTYKTNKFKMPLLNVIGITSFNTTFNSCFIFMKGEEKTDYQWALTHIAHLFDGMSKPGVIVTDRELALMNALEMIFPNSANLLCLWHIRKNILKNCKQHFSIAVENDEEGDGWQLFLGKWNDVVESITEVEFNEKWQMFCSTYDNKPHVITYFKDTWIPWKEKFVKAWTNGFFHLGTTVTSRVEGAHSNLKANLQVSTGDLYRVHAVISLMVTIKKKKLAA
ncbi:unnamed protein product [Rhizophagus irregularis]|nr:unnamed protein product [Rhizophagus irregularis]